LKKYIIILLLAVLSCFIIYFTSYVENNKKTEEQINKLQAQGYEYYSNGENEKSLAYYQKALVKAEKLYGKNSTATASIYTGMALPYIKVNKKDKAADSIFTAAEMYKKSAMGLLVPAVFYKLQLQAGGMYCDLGKTQKAFMILKQAEKDIDKLPTGKEPMLFRHLADCYHSMKQYEQAVKYCRKAIQKNDNDENTPNNLTHIYDVWGNSLVGQNKRKQAIEKLKISLKYASQANMSINFIGQLLRNIGINYMELDEYKKAKGYMFKALAKFNIIEKERFSEEGITYLYLARNARYHSKWKEAEKYYEKSAELIENSLQSLKSYGFNKIKLAKAEENAFVALCIAYKWRIWRALHIRQYVESYYMGSVFKNKLVFL